MAPRKRGSTATSNFGVSKREGHDASAFYSRFETPEFSDLEIIGEPKSLDEIICGSSTNMSDVADNSVALVVTSPPYFAGKAYEEEISLGHVPASYVEYLENLTEVFAECVRTLEPGGRIAVNVANLGRRPYRSLSADVTHILQDRLKLWLRGEIIWVKARGAGGNCAWGSFQQPSNPVLRDLSERIIVASKGRLDRVVRKDRRERDGLPSVSTITRDEFLDYTTDVWEFAPESASRIGHPAPYPIELPARLITAGAARCSTGGRGGEWSMRHSAATGAPTRLSMTRTTSRFHGRPWARASTRSPTFTLVAAFAGRPLISTCPPRQASVASERVL